MKFLLLASLLLIFPAFAFAQSKTEGKAIVYVYSNKTTTTFGMVKKPVFMDDMELADVRPAHYFIVLVDPGKHSFHLKKKKFGGVEMDFEAGKTYYLRLEWRNHTMIGNFGIVAPENAAFDLKQMKPVDQNNIKNTKLVVLTLE